MRVVRYRSVLELESAAVMTYLSRHADWREDAVVRRMLDSFASLRHGDDAAYRAALAPKSPHRVPERYLATLDACR